MQGNREGVDKEVQRCECLLLCISKLHSCVFVHELACFRLEGLSVSLQDPIVFSEAMHSLIEPVDSVQS